MRKIKKGDLVQIMSGRSQTRGGDRGKQGQVLSVEEDRVVVEGLNLVAKHVKRRTNQRGGRSGGVENVPAPMHISKVAVVDPEQGVPTKVGIRVERLERGGVTSTRRVRYAKKSGKDLP